MANVLLVTAEFEPFQSSGINRLRFFKQFLENQGHYVAVLTTNTNAQGLKCDKGFDRDNNIYRAFTLSLLCRKLLSSRRFPIYQKLSRMGKYDLWSPFAVKKGKKLVGKLNIDVILSSFPDFTSIQVAEKISRLTKTKLILDFRDPPFWIYDEVTINSKIKYCQKIIEKAVHGSSQIVVCTENSAKSLAKHYNVAEKIEIISNGYDADVISALMPYTARNDDFIEVVHIGSFYDEGRDIKPIVYALEQQGTKQNKKIKLRLIGDIPDAQTIAKIKSIAAIIQVTLEPPVKMQQALAIAKQADILLLLQGERFDRQIPAKAYEYLALNRPIWAVVSYAGETHKLLTKYSSNIIFSNYSDINDIKIGAANLFTQAVRELDVSNLSRQIQTTKLNTFI